MKKTTYKQAGVDVRGASRFIQSIRPLAKQTRRPGLLRGIGGFGGLFELDCNGSKPILVASADGVGTKLKIAQLANNYAGLGVDLVAMNVNDLICTGAEPIFFLDYIATGKLEPKVLVEVIRGVVKGCVESRCVLLGGETAQMSLLYKPGEFDLAGFAVGVIRKRRAISGDQIRPGDRLLGIASSGVHSNGFVLVQRVLSKAQQKKMASELLKPTRIYVRPILDLLDAELPLHGIAHITGGSFPEKLGRVLPRNVDACIYKQSWKVPALFRKIQAAGVAEEEMYKTFNMGIGMVLALPDKSVTKAQQILKKRGFASWTIGEVIRGRGKVLIE